MQAPTLETKRLTLSSYLANNWKCIVLSLVLGTCFALLVVPRILAQDWIRSILAVQVSLPYFLVAVIPFLFLLIAYTPSLAFWARYRNNVSLKEVPFTYADGLSLFVGSSIVTMGFFHKHILDGVYISEAIVRWIAIFALFFMAWCVLVRSRARLRPAAADRQPNEVASTVFFPDEPITRQDEDELDRKQFVDDLHQQISEFPFQDSFVFGLYGKWGEGKTSVLNLTKEKLYGNDRLIVFEFDPWYFTDNFN